jgi:hypothetical protein
MLKSELPHEAPNAVSKKKARVHHAARRRSSGVAAGGARDLALAIESANLGLGLLMCQCRGAKLSRSGAHLFERLRSRPGSRGLHLLATALQADFSTTEPRSDAAAASKTNARMVCSGGDTCSEKAFVSQCAAETICGDTLRQKSCNINKTLDSERFRSTPRTCGRFRGILSLR